MWGRHSSLEMEETFKRRLEERARSSDPWKKSSLAEATAPQGKAWRALLEQTPQYRRVRERKAPLQHWELNQCRAPPPIAGAAALRQLSVTPLLTAKLRRGSQSRLEHMPMVGAFGRLP